VDGGAWEGFLAESSLFGALPDEARRALAERLVPRSVEGGELVICEGDEADGLYLVVGGRLQARRGDGEETVVLGEIGRGEVFGEAALLTDRPRVASVVALRDTELLHLPVDAFEALVAEHPALLRPVTTQVVERMVAAGRGPVGTRPVSTLAVVPVHGGEPAQDGARGLADALVATVPGGAVVGETDAPAGTGEVAWTQELEAAHDLVVFLADADPGPWTLRCLRQADAVVLVADAAQGPALTAVEETLAEHRRRVAVPVELVLVHAANRGIPAGTSRWLAPRQLRRHHHIRRGNQEDAGRAARLITNRAVGLVLSGGGARGMAEIGVLRALRELEVPIDAVGGTSAGSLVAGAIARGWSVDQITSALRKGMVESGNPVDVTMPIASLAAGRRVTERLKGAAGEIDIEDLWLDFFCVSTNLSRNRPHVHRSGPGWRAIRASMSIPGIFPPVAEGGDVLVDGGLVDNLPVAEMRRGHEAITVVAVDVGVHRGLAAGDLPESTIVDGWRLALDRLHPRRTSPDVVGILTVLTRLTELGGGESTTDADLGDVLVTPDVERFPILDFENFDELVEQGYRDGMAVLEPWAAARP